VKGILDTCTMAEFRRPEGSQSVKAFVAEFDGADLFLSVISLGEIVKGISLLEPGKRKKALTSWLTPLENRFRDRILAIAHEAARIWGELTARAQKKGLVVPDADGLLAATVLRHGFHVVTRNTRHFQATGALIVDPWENQ
jgi:toxin FitB